jgi:hypothetical protein
MLKSNNMFIFALLMLSLWVSTGCTSGKPDAEVETTTDSLDQPLDTITSVEGSSSDYKPIEVKSDLVKEVVAPKVDRKVATDILEGKSLGNRKGAAIEDKYFDKPGQGSILPKSNLPPLYNKSQPFTLPKYKLKDTLTDTLNN